MIFNIVLSIIMMIVGIFGFLNPTAILSLNDLFRIKGEREYTEFAIIMTKIGGVVAFIGGILIIIWSVANL